MMMTTTMMIYSSNSDYWQWRHFSQSLGSNISYSLWVPVTVMCDMQKTSVSNWQRYCFTIEKKTLQKVTVTVIVNDCTTISISECSYINVHSTTDNFDKCQYYLPLWLQYRLPFELAGSAKFWHFTILGVHRPPSPQPSP